LKRGTPWDLKLRRNRGDGTAVVETVDSEDASPTKPSSFLPHQPENLPYLYGCWGPFFSNNDEQKLSVGKVNFPELARRNSGGNPQMFAV